MNKSNVANDVDNTTLYTCDKKLPGVQRNLESESLCQRQSKK